MSVCLFVLRISLVAEPIGFSFTGQLFIGPAKVQNHFLSIYGKSNFFQHVSPFVHVFLQFRIVFRLDVIFKIHFFEFISSAYRKSYFRGLKIHAQNFIFLPFLANQCQASEKSTDNGSTAILTISQQCAGFKLFFIYFNLNI